MKQFSKQRAAVTPLVLVILCLLRITAPAQWTNGARAGEELQAQLEAHLSHPRFHGALWGVKIVSLDTKRVVFERHADRLMSPASNSKLYTGALALDHLGGDYRIRTPVVATAKPNQRGKLRGDVIIRGRGDPSWMPGPEPTDFWTVFDPFVAVLTNAGVRRVTGDIIADATFFHGPPTGASWTVDDLEDYYGAEISATTLADNYAQLRVAPGAEAGRPCTLELVQPHTGLILDNRTTTTTNSGASHIVARRIVGGNRLTVFGELPAGGTNEVVDVTVPRPADWFAASLKEALVRRGIRVDGDARGVCWPEPSPVTADCVELGEMESPPLRDLVRAFMKRSQNLETDLIFGHIGEATRSGTTPVWRTSEQLAVAALEGFLRTNDLPVDDLHFDEGSGLSRNNLTSANATVGLLQFMATHPASNDFLNSLPVAGVDGTLRRRIKGTPAEGNLRAKTGTLRWANALSGYVTSVAGERFVFCLMLNRYQPPPDRTGRDELDAIAVLLAQFSNHSDTTLESLYAPQGRLILAPLDNAPFPHSSRGAGHVYRQQYFSAPDHYSDSTVAIFVPRGFRETAAVDFVVYFHGWNNSVPGVLGQFQLIEQFVTSGKNAVLVVPAGPHNAPDSFGGKLEDPGGFRRFMDDVLAVLRESGVSAGQEAGIGNVILTGHSGGYHVMAGILERGGLSTHVKEVWLFDALYGGTESFLAWQTNQNGRLLVLHTDDGGTMEETRRAMGLLGERRIDYRVAEESSAVEAEWRTNRVLFLHSELAHSEVVAKRGQFSQCLGTSSLEDK
jgi:D-alanyl-D-alanine carboxypeptidase/D-alanyl-D-alanine-endopeptidase (penicillin-binding protein 4)